MAIAEITESETRKSQLGIKIGARLREVRQRKGLTLKDVAIATSTSPQTVQRLEAAVMPVTPSWMERLCKCYGIDPIELLGPEASWRVQDEIIRMRAEAEAMRTRAAEFTAWINQFLERTK